MTRAVRPSEMIVQRPPTGGLVSLFVLSFLVNALFLVGPIFMMQVYDRVLSSGSIPTLIGLFLIVVILYLAFGCFDLIRQQIANLRGEEIAARYEPLAFAASIAAGAAGETDARSSAPEDVEIVRSYLTSPGLLAIFDAPAMPFYFLAIVLLHPVLGAVVLVAAAVLAVLAVLNERTSRAPMSKAQGELGLAGRILSEARVDAESLKANNMVAALSAHWIAKQASARQTLIGGQARVTLYSTATKTLRLTIQSLVLGVGAWLAVEGKITPGAMIAASIIFARAIAPLEQVLTSWRPLLRTREAWARIQSWAPDGTADPAAFELPAPTQSVEAIRVEAAAPGSNNVLVRDATFSLKAGDVLAVTGPSGAGKTCLLRVLAGAWPAHSGAVRLDGADLPQWPSEALAKHVGYLGQSVSFVEGRVTDLISRFGAKQDDAAVLTAAKQAGVHALILGLPDGYDTYVGPGGVQLSGGQRQRIGLARALYGDPFLLVMDEPVAHLDAPGEAAFVAALKTRSAAGKISVFTCHGERMLGLANKMVVVEGGRMIVSGPRGAVLKQLQKLRTEQA